MSLDRKFITTLITEDEALRKAIDANIQDNWILKELRPAYQWIKSFYTDFGKIPSRESLIKRFGDILTLSEENVAFYISEIRNRQKFSVMVMTAEQVSNLLMDDKQPDKTKALEEAEKLFNSAHKQLYTELNTSKVVNIAKKATDRYDQYLHRKSNKITGVITPWEPLTEETMGWQPGEFALFVGRRGLGKTLTLLLNLSKAYQAGYKPLLFTHEMGVKPISLRLDAILGQFDYEALRKGKLDLSEERAYLEYLKRMEESEMVLEVAEGAGRKGVETIYAYCRTLKPDIVFVDSAYLFAKSYDWKDQYAFSADLRAMAESLKIPIIISLQEKKDGVAIAKAYENDATCMFRQYKDKDMEELPFMCFETRKIREGEPIRWVSHWDFKSMNFTWNPQVDPQEYIDI